MNDRLAKTGNPCLIKWKLQRFRIFLFLPFLPTILAGCGDSGGKESSAASGFAQAPVISLTASPSSVGNNGSSTLTWSVTNAASCQASGAWSGTKALSGSETGGPLTQTSTFILYCERAGNSTTRAVTVIVNGQPPPPAPTVSLMANPDSVSLNGSSTLTWASTGATSCTASGDWSGTKATVGSQAVGPLTATSTFTLVCGGPGGSADQSVIVTVDASPPSPAPTISLTANPSSIAYNDSSTLTWSSMNSTSCAASGDWSGNKATSGSQAVGPLTTTSTFILACSGAGGSAGRTVTVIVNGSTAVLQLSWAPNTDPIDGYIIYSGPSAGTASTQLSVIPLTAPGFDPQAPAVDYNAADLGLSAGQTVCFRLKTYNSAGSSGFSGAACITL